MGGEVREDVVEIRPWPGAAHTYIVPTALIRCPHDGSPVWFTIEEIPEGLMERLGIECHGQRRTVVVDACLGYELSIEDRTRQRLGLYTELVKALPAPEEA